MSCFNYISPEAAERFFSDEAKNEKLGWFPPELLVSGRQVQRMRKLAMSEKATDRLVAAGSPSTPPVWLDILRLDGEVQVRRALVKNPAVSRDIVETMGKFDEDEGIRAYAKFRLDNET